MKTYNDFKSYAASIASDIVECTNPTPETDGSILFKHGIEVQCTEDGYYINLWDDKMEEILSFGADPIVSPALAVVTVKTELRKIRCNN